MEAEDLPRAAAEVEVQARPGAEPGSVAVVGVAHASLHGLAQAGQQRRVALARLKISRAPLWILDEPFTALDKDGVSWLEGELQAHVSNGGAVIITSHHALEGIPGLRRLELGGVV